MQNHMNGILKSGDSDIRPGGRTCDTAETLQSDQQKVNVKKTGNNSRSQLSETDTHNVFTDYDAVEILNNVLEKKAECPVLTLR